jgi:outer membrane protein
MRSAILLTILLISILDSKAQSVLTLNQCIEYAFKNNNDIKIQENELIKNKINLKQAGYSLLPSVNASYSHKYNAGRSLNYETYSWENREIQQGDLSVAADLVVFRGLYGLYNRNIMKSQINISKLNIEKSKLFIGIETIKSYYSIRLINTNISIYDNVLTNTQKEISKLQEKINAGVVSKVGLYEMNAQEKKELVSKINLESLLVREYNNLNYILNWHEESSLSVSEVTSVELDSLKILNNNLVHIIDNIVSNSILMAEKDLNLKLTDYTIKKQKSNYFPKVSINSYFSSRYLLDAVNPVTHEKRYNLNTQIIDNRTNEIDLVLAIPLFNKFDNRTNIKLLEVEKSQIILRYDSEIQSLKKNLEDIKDDILSLKKRITETTNMVIAYQKSYDAALEQYKSGQLDSYAMSSTKNNYINAQLELNRNIIEYNMNLEILKFYEEFSFLN